jgi:anti-sigma regulatory factor (Ser/Thr protein kinase)
MVGSVMIELSAHPTSIRAAAEFVTATLESWGWTENTETAVLLTNELVTNAIFYAETDIAVTLRGDGSVRVEVFDHSTEEPNTDDLDSTHGLGLVQALSTVWGVTPAEDGKAVWFELGR